MFLRRLLIGSAACLVVLTSASMAQSADREADHDALRQLMKKTTAAINAQDLGALSSCMARDFVFVTIDQTVITNREGITAYYDRMLKGKDAPIASLACKPEAEILTRFVGENAGYCYGKSTDVYTLKDKRLFTLDVRWSSTVVKEDGQWKIATAHTGVDFMDNPVLTVRSMSFWRKLGILLHLVKPPYTVAK
jgi:uncharacterized protein (TIGR02246 family)